MHDNLYGVWANRDIEMVISKELILKFERKDDLFIASLFHYELDNESLTLYPKAVAVFENTAKSMGMKYINHINNKIEFYGDTLPFKIEIEKMIYKVKAKRDSFILGNVILEKIEELGEVKLDSLVYAKEDNIGQCLREWNMGTSYFLSNENSSFRASIRTNKHSYIFAFNPAVDKPMVYCRAARLSSNNNGSVFSQNFRMMYNNLKFTAYMAEDNLHMAGSELVIDDSQFQKNQCTFSEAGPIYWSLKEFSRDRIVLNGCGGDEYVHTRP